MSSTTSFKIARFKNRNGTSSWRVSGWFHGVRIRKNFKTKEEAAAEKTLLEIRSVQAATGLRAATTFLPDEQLREAEAAFRRLRDGPRSLTFYLDYALANYREPTTQKPLVEAVAEYVATKEHEHEQDLLSEPHLTRLKRDLERLKKHFPCTTVAELTGPRLMEYFEARRAGLKTFNNRRGIVSTFLKHALQRGWIVANPLDRIPPRRIRRRRGGAITFDSGQAAALMAHVETHSMARVEAMDGSSIPGFVEQVLSSLGAGYNWTTNGSRVAAGMPVTSPAHCRAGKAGSGGWEQPEQPRLACASVAAGIRGDSMAGPVSSGQLGRWCPAIFSAHTL